VPGEINCVYIKVLIPFVEREVGPEAGATVCRAAGRSRDYLMADHNWIPVDLSNRLMRLGQELMGDPDDAHWLRRYTEFAMDWKPREERSYLGTWSMGMGDPRPIFVKCDAWQKRVHRWEDFEVVEIQRSHARFRSRPRPGFATPWWVCVNRQVTFERTPTNWGLPRAVVVELTCAAKGDDCCLFDVRWRNPRPGRNFWLPAAAGALGAIALPFATLASGTATAVTATAIGLPALLAGIAAGAAVRAERRRRDTQRLLDLQGEEIMFSNDQLERKFQDLEGKIEQLSLLTGLSAAVNATLDPERIYGQALDQLVHRMGYQAAYLFLLDPARGVLRNWRFVGGGEGEGLLASGPEFPLDTEASVVSKVAVTGLPVLVRDAADTTEPLHRPTVEALGHRSLLAVPLRVKDRLFGVLAVSASEPGRLDGSDEELLSTVANHVVLAVDRAQSFQTIEELSRGLEDKVRVRTEQLRTANDDLQAAYRELQATQMQLIQREKMASVGQLVAGVAHELNNPIGFVYSNVGTLEDFVRRLRDILETYRGAGLVESDRARVEERWQALKVDYALKYLDSMTQGIKEGAERARKIVRDLRVFARSQDDVWQSVDLHEEIDSSLTLLNHLLKDRVTVERRLADLPPVECIRSQIDQVFLNLLANAAQAIEGPGTISIETRVGDGMAVVRIADTGPGIPAEVIGRIFDPFFTTKPVGEGTGLGLSISYEILKKHGGDITAANRPDVMGSVFTVRLPIARKDRT
jgi:signal transduction histidine kinase